MIFGEPVSGFSRAARPGDMIFGDKDRVVQKHIDVWKEQVDAVHEHFPDHCEFINSHSCKDYFTEAMAERFFDEALAHNPDVMHEGHRKRFLHSPWVCRDFLPKFPNLKFVADLSHFTTIAETDPNDPDLTRVIEQIAHQTYHVHCRVGYDHGPQVSDPRAGVDTVYGRGSSDGGTRSGGHSKIVGIRYDTPEHGPPSYQQTAPHSREPLAHIWDVNHWVALRRAAF